MERCLSAPLSPNEEPHSGALFTGSGYGGRCLAASPAFAGRIATADNRAPIDVTALGTFILLHGLGLPPLPGGSAEAFMSRLLNVIVASAYAIGALSLMERWTQPAA